jgi:hypothetical protein
MKAWDEATVSYCLSNQWHHSNKAQSELYYIARETGRLPQPDQYNDWYATLERRRLPTQPDILWPRSAWELGNYALDNPNPALARFCFSIVVDLTGLQEARQMLEKCGEPFEG